MKLRQKQEVNNIATDAELNIIPTQQQPALPKDKAPKKAATKPAKATTEANQPLEIRRTYKFRLYPNQTQIEALQATLRTCCFLYNSALQERRDTYRLWKEYGQYRGQADNKPKVNMVGQSRELTRLKPDLPEFKTVYSQVLTDVLKRIEKTFDNFYRRVKNGETPGYPRWKKWERYHSFTYTDPTKLEGHTKAAGWSLCNNKLTLSKVGGLDKAVIKIKLHRSIMGRVCLLTIKREGKKWFACFSVVYHQQPAIEPVNSKDIAPTQKAVGIDVGLNHFATLSNGEKIENPRFYRNTADRLAKAQQACSTKKPKSKRRKKAQALVGVIHRKIANQRKDFLHKESRKLVNQFDLIFFEDLQIKNMVRKPKPKEDAEQPGHFLPNNATAKGGLNKSILDAGWGYFTQFTAYKAAEAGKLCDKVDPKNTSQGCSECGSLVPKLLSERTHKCPDCGIELDRDHNAAREVEYRGLSKHDLLHLLSWKRAGTPPAGKPANPLVVSKLSVANSLVGADGVGSSNDNEDKSLPPAAVDKSLSKLKPTSLKVGNKHQNSTQLKLNWLDF